MYKHDPTTNTLAKEANNTEASEHSSANTTYFFFLVLTLPIL